MVSINATKVLIEDIPELTEKTQSGIIIPTTVKAKTMRGKILIVGDGTPDIKIKHQVGDIALFHPSAGTKFTWEDREVRLVDVNEIFLSSSV
jgi:chaperonin GroES